MGTLCLWGQGLYSSSLSAVAKRVAVRTEAPCGLRTGLQPATVTLLAVQGFATVIECVFGDCLQICKQPSPVCFLVGRSICFFRSGHTLTHWDGHECAVCCACNHTDDHDGSPPPGCHCGCWYHQNLPGCLNNPQWKQPQNCRHLQISLQQISTSYRHQLQPHTLRYQPIAQQWHVNDCKRQ